MKKESKTIKIHKSKLLTSLFVATVILSVSASAFVPMGNNNQINSGIGTDKSKELRAGTIWYVNDTATGNNTGENWEHAFNTSDGLQNALAVAQPDDQIWVAEGIYKPDRSPGAREDSFELKEDVEIYGGFAGNEVTLEERAGLFDETVLSGDLDENDIIDWPDNLDNNEENTIHVVRAINVFGAVLDGFNITAGYADGENGADDANGSGINIIGGK